MKFQYFILILLSQALNLGQSAFSQDKKIDSILFVLNNARQDTTKANTLNALSTTFLSNREFDKAMSYAKGALSLAQKLDFKKGVAAAYRVIGLVAAQQGNYAEAKLSHEVALKLSEQMSDKYGIARYYQDMGMFYYLQDNDPEALNNFYKALKLFDEINDLTSVANMYLRIGGSYFYLKNYSEAEKNNLKALEVFEKTGEREGAAYTTKSLGILRFISGNAAFDAGDKDTAKQKYREAIVKHQPAIKIYEETADRVGLLETYPHVGNVYEKLGSIALEENDMQASKNYFMFARKYYSEFLQIAEETDDENYITEACNGLGKLYLHLKEYSKAKQFLQRGLLISTKRGYKVTLRDGYELLAELGTRQGNYKNALRNYKMFILYKDSLGNEEIVSKAEGYKMRYEFEKKEDQIQLLSTENKLKTTLASKQKQQKEFAFAGIAATLLVGGYGFYRYRRRKKIQSQQAVLSERLRISSELHDEVGATLSGIAMYSHLTKEQMKTGQIAEIEKSLNVMQQSSAQMVDKLSDIVWLINPEQDTLQKLVTRLEEYATDMAAIKNMQVKISVPEKITEINLPVESRRNIYLFCKEAINNAVKYSNATLLELTVKEVNGKLEFSVSDNGKGFDVVMVRRGNGLENMQKRADEIGAKLILQSKENEGASVSLQCKIT